ncbi:hypothetical protein CHLRE_09g390550v5 [Chlamydomonas reinhardtii]|nr:uncharacterized protein CHLRE_09g390550v5 [Chlamydomonas reinhardtii]PNW78598.1 hypothetical protein CHLRE_09g390550v5 [Chlamydomonas reinhardtii]
MSQGLGWGTTLSEVRARTSQRVTSKHGFDQAADCPREGLAELLPRQQPDMQLYRLGRVLSFLDVVFLDLARQAGQTPEGVAAAARGEREGAVEGAEGKEGGAEEGAAGADCGILGRSRRRDNGKGSDTDGRHMR